MTETETACSSWCGYISNGRDLWEHQRYEHADCPECGAEPHGPYSVTHKQDCPRLRPGYRYPGPVPAEYEDEVTEV